MVATTRGSAAAKSASTGTFDDDSREVELTLAQVFGLTEDELHVDDQNETDDQGPERSTSVESFDFLIQKRKKPETVRDDCCLSKLAVSSAEVHCAVNGSGSDSTTNNDAIKTCEQEGLFAESADIVTQERLSRIRARLVPPRGRKVRSKAAGAKGKAFYTESLAV